MNLQHSHHWVTIRGLILTKICYQPDMYTTFGPLPKCLFRKKSGQRLEISSAPWEHKEKDTHKLLSQSVLFFLIYSLRTALETCKSDFPSYHTLYYTFSEVVDQKKMTVDQNVDQLKVNQKVLKPTLRLYVIWAKI